jgi:protein involved in polysaccharide export with SLBB domain
MNTLKKYLPVIFVFMSFTRIIFAQTEETDLPSMLALNAISVTIGGEFIINGSFDALATERVDQFVTRIHNQTKIAMLANARDRRTLEEMRIELEEYAKRGVELRRADGTKSLLDLEKFRLTADFNHNPYLKDGDVLIFRPYDWKRNFIEVEGAVNKPIVFQYMEGDKLSDALMFARGLNPAYENVTLAEITRLSYDGKNEEILTVPVDSDFNLQRADRIRIVSDETQKRDFKVLVAGEVSKPGYIFITKETTTIKEVIEKAGGFKENADLRKAELIRSTITTQSGGSREDPYQDRKRSFDLQAFTIQADLLMMQRMSDIVVEDSLTFISDNELRHSRANVSVDFREVLIDSSENSQFIVKDGDIIYVPEIEDLVYVFGQVMNPGFIEHVDEVKYDYYINRAGGIGNLAKSEVYLIKGKSRAWIDMTDAEVYTIESGDYIWVPKDVPRNFDYYLTRTAQIAAVVAAMATVILLFK